MRDAGSALFLIRNSWSSFVKMSFVTVAASPRHDHPPIISFGATTVEENEYRTDVVCRAELLAERERQRGLAGTHRLVESGACGQCLGRYSCGRDLEVVEGWRSRVPSDADGKTTLFEVAACIVGHIALREPA